MNLHCSVIDASAARLSTKAHRSQRLRRLAARLASVGSAAGFGILALLGFNQAPPGLTPDVAVWRDFGQDYLLAGYCWISATNGREAIEAAIRDVPRLAVMDVVMPEMDGLSALLKLKQAETDRK